MSETGTKIKTFRERFGFSQEALAGYLSVKREMISYYETGTRSVPLEALEKLATLFGVDLDFFFNDDIETTVAEMAFAFRAGSLNPKDLEAIAGFKKIVKNYQRMVKLETSNAKK